MNNTRQSAPKVRELLARAEREAAESDRGRALELFSECTREYLRRQLPFKAIAVAKRARKALGPGPKVSALIIRTYRATGFLGDARDELEAAASAIHKDELPFFAALDDDAFLDLLSIMEPVSFPEGKTIVKRMDPGEDVFVILSGSCEVIRDGKAVAVMRRGDVFGEIGFFGQAVRSASVRALTRCHLVRIPSGPLHEAQDRHPLLLKALEDIYSERIVRKAAQDIQGPAPEDARLNVVATLCYRKGQEIPALPADSVAILKHGTVEVDYDEPCLKTKRYLKPGSIVSHGRTRALASTNVVIMITKVREHTGREREGT